MANDFDTMPTGTQRTMDEKDLEIERLKAKVEALREALKLSERQLLEYERE